jgi:hypothetical protein
MEYLQPKLSSVNKPLPIYREMIIDITRKLGGATILMKLLNTRDTVQADIRRATNSVVTEHA